MSEKKNDWKKTLNLPETPFPMKAQLNQKEGQILRRWQDADIYRKILAGRQNQPLFILHDGPPYANGMIHLGTAMNKILKDFIIKSRTMEGFLAPYVPGWDCHGLPIELRVDKLLGEQKKKIGIIELREECRKYAEKYLNLQRDDFVRLGIFGEWENPYTTLQPRYEATIIRYFNSFVRNGNIYRKKRPVHWCISCQTALAEAEVIYLDHTSHSIYVKFKLLDMPKILKKYKDKEINVLIWTTTPWTIPANLAIALHPEFDYALFRIRDEYMIAATRLIPVIADLADASFEKLVEFKGADLSGCHTQHPLYSDRRSLIINTDYVLLDQGTGCVHTAPGHGEEDYIAGIQFNLDIYSPVDGSGNFDDTTGKYIAKNVFDANAEIVEDLKRGKRLLYSDTIVHAYPHCWRCKNPVIFRATEQWFIAMDVADLRQKSLAAIRGIQWRPKWGEERIYSMIENRPDWCISRQRDWGVPLPVFFCQDCGEALLDPEVIDNVASVFEKLGSNSWYEKETDVFIPSKVNCGKCGRRRFEKSMDIIDVWFESGSSHGILDQYPGHRWPADVYIEGGDQYRGWFHSSLLVGISVKQASPFRIVISHGWMLDDQGRAMSKSLGNTIEPQEIIKDKGAEIIRLWVSMINYQEDARMGSEILARVVESYRKIRNTWRFMLGVLNDYRPDEHTLETGDLSELDLYILQRFQQVKARILKAYREFEYFTVFHTIFNFFTVDLSAFYLNIQKDNLYCNPSGSRERKASQAVIFRMLKESLQLLAPILVFTAEEAWEHLPAHTGKEASVHLSRFPGIDARFESVVDEGKWERILQTRDRILKEIEEARARKDIGDSLEADITYAAPAEALRFLKENETLVKEILIVSGLDLQESDQECITVNRSRGRKCPRCWNWFYKDTSGQTHPELCPRCSDVIGQIHADA